MTDNKFSNDIEVTINDFKYDNGNFYLKNNKKKGLIVIYAPWCGYCNMLAPIWSKFAKEYKNEYTIKALNVENKRAGNKKMAEQLGVQGFPTIKYIDESGKIGKTYEGDRSKEDFKKFLSQ